MTRSTRKRRLYFLFPDIQTTRQAVDELLLARVEERHMHALAQEELDLEDLPRASSFQQSDIVHGSELGLVVGGLTGLLVGALVAWLMAFEIATGGGLVLGLALLGALIGAWAAGLVGSSIPNTRLAPFQKDLDRGCILLMVDIPEERMEEIRKLIRSKHPKATDHGPEPTTPAFP